MPESAKGRCKSREAALKRALAILSEQYDAGVGVFCYEDGGETKYNTIAFGNRFAVDAMANQLSELISEDKEEGAGQEEEEEDC